MAFKKGFKKWAEDKSLQLRKELGLQCFDPLNAFDVCTHLQIHALYPSYFSEFPTIALKQLTKSDSAWSALTMKNFEGIQFILHNHNHSPQRQQSNLMHELAHILCEHTPDEESDESIILQKFGLRKYNEQHEQEAEYLGGALQIPRDGLMKHLFKERSMHEIAHIHLCSVQLVQYRLNITGVKRQYENYRKKKGN